MKKANDLNLLNMGMDFFPAEKLESDVGNYRVRTMDAIAGKDGRNYFMEFGLWRDRKRARTTHKVTGKPLKHVAYDVINREGLHVELQYKAADGYWYGEHRHADAIHAENYAYTKENILKAVNLISAERFDRVVFWNRSGGAAPRLLEDY